MRYLSSLILCLSLYLSSVSGCTAFDKNCKVTFVNESGYRLKVRVFDYKNYNYAYDCEHGNVYSGSSLSKKCSKGLGDSCMMQFYYYATTDNGGFYVPGQYSGRKVKCGGTVTISPPTTTTSGGNYVIDD